MPLSSFLPKISLINSELCLYVKYSMCSAFLRKAYLEQFFVKFAHMKKVACDC
jgi:hypothetical protein